MKHMYYDVDGWATINVVDLTPFLRDRYGPTFIIQGVEVTPRNRGKGVARDLMRHVLEDADREGVTLVLTVVAPKSYGHPTDPRQGLSYEQLYAWYSRLGFESNAEIGDPNAMVRWARSAVNA